MSTTRTRLPTVPVVSDTVRAPDGRCVHTRRTAGAAVTNALVLIAPGFGQTSRHTAPLACYLGANGIGTVRYDSLDHPGASSGDIQHFTMSSALDSLAIAAQSCCPNDVVIVANSLSARAAFRYAADSASLIAVIALLGVVDLKATLTAALGRDYSTAPRESLPPHFSILGHDVSAGPFADDAKHGRWLTMEETERDLDRIVTPVTNIIVEGDDWVDLGQVRSLFEVTGHHVAVLPGSRHRIGSDLAAVRVVLEHMTKLCRQAAGLDDGEQYQPSFSEIARQSLYEKTL